MGKPTSIIELNGQRFNARTGVALDGMRPVASKLNVKTPMQHPLVVRTVTSSKHVHKTSQPSRTLMRSAVKKPSTITDRVTIAMDVVPHAQGESITKNFHATNPDRTKRAHAIHKLPTVSRFGAALVTTHLTQSAQPAVTKPQLVAGSIPSSTIVPRTVQTSAQSKTNMMLDKGMRASTSHTSRTAKKQKLRHKVGSVLGLSKRATSIAAVTLSVFSFGTFFTYQNIPNINVRYAAAKSGVNASIPSYQPAGFSVNNHVQFSPGELTIAYKANADDRAYTVSQKNTSWNSDALKDHLVTKIGTTPMTYPDSGRTIYLHDDSSADWVQSGVWYSITGESSLNTDQLIKIATSI